MKEGHDLLGQRIDSSEVWTLMEIAAVASQRQVVWIIGAAVLLGYDVFHMMDEFAVFLVQPAIFATLASPEPNEFPSDCVHLLLNRRFQKHSGFQLEYRNEIRRVNQCLIFSAFAIVE
jgi:hypothetical protein